MSKRSDSSKQSVFSGPPSNKMAAATFATAAATLFWTIAAHTFWTDIDSADLALYISTSTTLVAALVGFFVPESAAYASHAVGRLEQRVAPIKSAELEPDLSLSDQVTRLEQAIRSLEADVTTLAVRGPSRSQIS